MSSFPLTNSIIFQDAYCTTNQLFWGWEKTVGFTTGWSVGSVGFPMKKPG
jgi:hypothetical protein